MFKNRYIGEAGRLISDILDLSDKLSTDSYLVTVVIEHAFNSLDHGLLLFVFKKMALLIISLIGSKYC